MHTIARATALLVTTVMTLAAAAAAPATEAAPRLLSANPLARPFYVDPASPARRAAGPGAAYLAGVAQAHWFTESTPTAAVARAVDEVVGPAAAGHALPTIVLYAIPHRDCDGYSSGGLPDAEAYAAWVRQVRVGIARRPVVVVVEPDALAAIGCLDEAGRSARYTALRDAVAELSADPGTAVYVDGGHSRWLAPTDLAQRLLAVGVGSARGFSLNVANFLPTAEEVGYGEVVADLLGGAHYVVDTSRNGAGPAPDGPLNWCNPPGRALGRAPTAGTGAPHADAFLWIKNPGQSDGTCDRGDPPSGEWFAAYADALVPRAAG